MVVRDNPALWERIKKEMLGTMCHGQWSARCAQLCVLEYKRRGGGYLSKKPTARNNSLRKWTEERWGYAGKEKQSRYLPEKVRDAMSPTLTRQENQRKGARLGEHVPYSEPLKRLMKHLDIF